MSQAIPLSAFLFLLKERESTIVMQLRGSYQKRSKQERLKGLPSPGKSLNRLASLHPSSSLVSTPAAYDFLSEVKTYYHRSGKTKESRGAGDVEANKIKGEVRSDS